MRAALITVTTLGVLGVVLAVIGLHDAFQRLPPREDHILATAIVLMLGTAGGVITFTRRFNTRSK